MKQKLFMSIIFQIDAKSEKSKETMKNKIKKQLENVLENSNLILEYDKEMNSFVYMEENIKESFDEKAIFLLKILQNFWYSYILTGNLANKQLDICTSKTNISGVCFIQGQLLYHETEENINKHYQNIKKFLENPDDIDGLCESGSVIFVDWREDDEDVVKYVNEMLCDNDKFDYTTEINEDGNFQIILCTKEMKIWNGKSITIFDPKSRDTTIKGLNDFIKPKNEIRWCMESLGSDTLGFVILSNEEWKMLEEIFGKNTVEHYFQIIHSESVMFDLDIDEVFNLLDARVRSIF